MKTSKLIAKAIFLSTFLLFSLTNQAQVLHDNSCSPISTNFSLDWDNSPGVNQYNWTPQGATSFTASNIQGSGYQIDFSVSGATFTLTNENGVSTPGITNSLSGGTDALHISSSGLTATQDIKVTMNFTPALAGDISFDLYNIIERAISGPDPGQQIEVYGLTSSGYVIIPQITDNGSPSWEFEGPGVLDGNSASTFGTNDQAGINFRSIADISSITVVMRRCSNCDQAFNTEFAIGDIDICLTPDTDQDGIPDTQDEDDDNDGIYDVVEKCPSTTPTVADWDNYPYNTGDGSNTYSLPDGTNMTVAISSNGASIVESETNSDLTGGLGGGTVGLFLNGNQNLQVNSIDVSFSWDQAIKNLSYTIFDVDQFGGQYVDSIMIIGFYDGFVVFPTMTESSDNTVTQNRAVGDVSTNDNLSSANVDVAFSEPIDSMVIYYGNGADAPAAPGNQWITIYDFTYIGDCGSIDSDGDGVADYLDIDSDNDGIVDYIEWQLSSSSPIQPAGADADNDGIDDNFESISAPVDTDGDGIPDFKDPDSDDDGDLDILEAWDTDNDGVANVTPSGIDSDGDGLDDSFDNQNGFNATSNVTNSGQTSSDFPNLDEGSTPERDWREDDDVDNDGIQNYADIDDDNDGILDVNEGRFTNDPVADEDGDGIPNWADTNDDGNGGDGSNSDYANSNADGIPDVYDVDNDGIPNHHDPDSDGDGIADIVEAGGTDSDGNGVVDGTFADSDNDGWSNVFDSDNGGTALADIDADGDALQNHLDIDADDDGIVDIIESQPTGALVSPSGTDSDEDGIDDSFDTDQGNSLTTPENTDAVDNADYLDTNADNDIDTDLVEGYDTNNDGSANTTPSNSDSDNDGLDDAFDNVSGQNSTTNITNSGQSSSSFPNQDLPGTTERDWREVNNLNDNDGDGIANADDIDDDNDGILDVDEGCTSPASLSYSEITGTSTGNVTGIGNIVSIDGSFAEWHTNGDIAVIDFGQEFPAGTEYVITWRERSGESGTAALIIEESTDNSSYSTHSSAPTTNSTSFINSTVVSENAFRYLRISKNNPPSTTDFEIDAIGIMVSSGSDVTPTIAGNIGSYTVASNGQLEVTMSGGDGGGAATAGGSGATINATFNVSAGDIVRFVVGEGSNSGTSAGGAGSSGLFINNTLMMVAGGGAGGDNSGGGVGLGATATTTGGNGNGTSPGSGGSGGAGGTVGGSDAGGGGGINSAGGSAAGNGGAAADLNPSNGVTFVSGGSSSGGGYSAGGGGFTGGGGASTGAYSGGGGGYSGGGAAGGSGGAGGGGSYLNTSDPAYVSGTITAGVTGGGGAVNTNGNDGEVTLSFVATDCRDTDGDGIIDAYDLDSDGDGIADIVEAGGVDTDGNGIVDGVFADSDGDGWSNVFDSDNGGSALADADTDGDGFENRIDIDSDDDGIVDIIESQPSGSLITPSGSDSDADGIDDSFDLNDGGILTTPENTDGTDNPDYTDTDSDNDGELDEIEGWDTNNDGVADTSPANSDADGDGLDDNYDDVNGLNSTTNITNGGQTSASFPDLDSPITPERDWREDKDYDNDGISDAIDIDDDNDGILDVDEDICDGGLSQSLSYEFYDLVPAGNTVDNIPTSGALSTGSVTSIDVDALQGAVDPGDAETFSIRYSGYINIATAGSYTFYTNSDDGSKLFIDGVEIVDNDGDHGATEESGVVSLTSGMHSILVLFFENGGDEILTVSYAGPSIAKQTLPFSILSESGDCDTDQDGVPNRFDLDSDNDGIADIIEAGGVDADRNGIVDGVFTDTDGDGWSNTFDSNNGGTALSDPDTDGDGFNDRIDIDADDDGIIDIIESQLTGVIIAPSGSDSDGDGIDDAFDPDVAAGLTVPIDTDGDSNPDYTDLNSDDDNHSDLIEGWDTDNDGNADVSPSGNDSDDDGLDDNFDFVVGPNSTTNVTNNGQLASFFPNLDNGNTAERDWREIQDEDGDGIADEFDLDKDNDGILDWDECNASTRTFSGGNGGSTNSFNVSDVYSGVFEFVQHDNSVAVTIGGTPLNANNILQFQGSAGAGEVFMVFRNDGGNMDSPWTVNTNGQARTRIIIDANGNVSVWGTRFANSTVYEQMVPQDGSSFNNISFSSGTTSISIVNPDDDGADLISGTAYFISECDNDGDGTPNYLDLDSDNDGIADIIEAGGVDNDGDGRADSNADANGDGYAGIFDPVDGGTELAVADTDGDGLPNYLDIDSDSDGLLDNLEAQSTNGRRLPDGNYSFQGWDTEYNGNAGGTPIVLYDFDSDGEPDITDPDADADGAPDWQEGFDDNNSEDALDDLIQRALDFVVNGGNPLYYNNLIDTDLDGTPNWLEDGDADNVPAFQDPDEAAFHDSDQDGMIDLYDSDDGGTESSTPDMDSDGEYDFRDVDNSVSLPIELLYFRAYAEGDRVRIEWETETEINNDYFEVERAMDAKSYSAIVKEKGAGNSTQRIKYVAYDENPMVGENYYRLRQVDYDGQTTVSKPDEVTFSPSSLECNIYPNPGEGWQLFLEMDNAKAGKYQVEIRTVAGKLINQINFTIEEEVIYYEKELLQRTYLAKGVYFIQLRAAETHETFKYIVK